MGRVAISRVRPVQLDDLLGRVRVKLDDAGLHDLLTGRPVLVTGAGGSIGSELCRQIARFGPSLLLLLDASEFALYQVEQEFREISEGCKPRALDNDFSVGFSIGFGIRSRANPRQAEQASSL